MSRIPPLPINIAWVICERAEVDETTGRANLFGVMRIADIRTDKYALYFLVRGAEGRYDVAVRVRYPRPLPEVILGNTMRTIEISPGQDSLEYAWNFENVIFPVTGGYQFELMFNGEVVATTGVQIVDDPGLTTKFHGLHPIA